MARDFLFQKYREKLRGLDLMGNDVVIRADGLGKKYLIGHQAERERYTALRDVIARNARNLSRSFSDMFAGRPNVSGDAVEEFWALKDISFEIKRGDVAGVIGRNGAGKSTLLKVLSRITEPTEGRVEIRGRVASLLEVGTGFHPELTGRENIYLNGAILGMTRAEIRRQFDEIVAFAEVEKFLDTPVKRYSSGMYVRLAFAVAAHMEPEILVVDEVLAVGDSAFQEKCLGKMESVSSHGRTVLFVSHNMATIAKLCKSAFLLRDGMLMKAGTTQAVLGVYTRAHKAQTENGLAYARREDAPWGAARIRSVTIQDLNGETVISVPSGTSVRVTVLVETREPITDLSATVAIRGTLTNQLLKAESRPQATRAALLNRVLTFECTIRELPFVPGEYLISVGIAHYGVKWIEELQDVALLEIREPTEGSFEMSRHAEGAVAAKHNWSVGPVSNGVGALTPVTIETRDKPTYALATERRAP
jgi:lipopolysaccharide transport system ATP-binding protein